MKKYLGKFGIAVLALCILLSAAPQIAVYADVDMDAVVEAFNAGIAAHEEYIDVKGMGLTTENIYGLSRELFSRSPYNYLFTSLRFTSQSGSVVSLIPVYSASAERAAEMIAEVDGIVNEIVDGIPDGADKVEQLLYVHDWLVLNTSYDTTLSIHDAYALFTQGTGVCDAYSFAMMAVCMRLDIPCVRITSDSMNHAWNRVQIDGEWYHIDATYNDPTPDRIGRVYHVNFLVSDAKLLTQDHSGFETGFCTSDRFDDGFWRETKSQVVRFGDDLLYVRESSAYTEDGYVIELVNSSDGSVLYSFNSFWPAPNGRRWLGAYSGIAVYGPKLLLNTSDRIFSFDPATGATENVFEYEGEKSIYALYTDKNGDIVCVLGSDPNATDDERLVLDLPLIGDADGNGTIDTIDLTLLRQYLADTATPIGAGADINGDGSKDTIDLTLLRAYLANPTAGFKTEAA